MRKEAKWSSLTEVKNGLCKSLRQQDLGLGGRPGPSLPGARSVLPDRRCPAARNRARPSGVVHGAGPAAPPRAGVASERLGIRRRPAAWPVVRGRGYTPDGEQKQRSKRPHVPVLPPGTACVCHVRGTGGRVLGVRASVGRSSRGRRTESGHRTRKQGFSPSSGTEAACFGVAGPQRLRLLPPPQFPHLTSGY